MNIKKNLATGFAAAMLSATALGGFQAVPALAGGGGCRSADFLDAATEQVDLKELCMYPGVVRIAAGRSIRWTNRDSVAHTVTGVSQSFGNYDSVAPGQAVTYRFDRDGVYPYFCLLHPGMSAVVVVGSGARVTFDPTGSIVQVQPAAARIIPNSATNGSVGSFALGALAVLVCAGILLAARRLRRD